MSDDSQHDKKSEYLQILQDVEVQAERLEELGGNIVRSARLVRDTARPFRDLISTSSTEDYSNHEIEAWRAWQRRANEIENQRTLVNSFSALTFAATGSSTSSTVVRLSLPQSQSQSQQDQLVYNRARTQVHQILQRYPLVEDATSLMRRLGLDSQLRGQRTPLALLKEAQNALELPSSKDGSPASVLIPLRESIDAVIAQLLKRRPIQEGAKKLCDKVISIGRQCAVDGLDEAYFERLGEDGEELQNILSTAKKADMPRERLMELFDRGLLFLNAVMKSIDESMK